MTFADATFADRHLTVATNADGIFTDATDADSDISILRYMPTATFANRHLPTLYLMTTYCY